MTKHTIDRFWMNRGPQLGVPGTDHSGGEGMKRKRLLTDDWLADFIGDLKDGSILAWIIAAHFVAIIAVSAAVAWSGCQ